MRCPWYLFHRLFCVWARTQGPHDPLLPGGPMSCQSAPDGVLSHWPIECAVLVCVHSSSLHHLS
ncbi:unnamed protein product, partial [Staurois parvus]